MTRGRALNRSAEADDRGVDSERPQLKAPSYLRKLKAFTRGSRSVSDLFALESELSYGLSDRAVAVLLGAMVEDTLRIWLLSHMRDDLSADEHNRLFGPDGASGTFSNKIMLAYAVGAIGSTTRHDLDLIRTLRNEFAHSRRPITFETDVVRAVCTELKFPDLEDVSTPKSYIDSAPPDARHKAMDVKHPRTRFFSACHTIAYRMIRLSAGPAATDGTNLPTNPLP